MATVSNGWKSPLLHEEKRALVARILASPPFEKATRLRTFLAYIADRALDDPGAKIREDEIASHVFCRPLDSQVDDTIVRVHASQLRKRLDQYFLGAGNHEELILEIPKGSYSPVFRRRTQVEPIAVIAEPGAAGHGVFVPAGIARGTAVLVAVLIVACGWLFYEWRASAAANAGAAGGEDATVRLFWSGFVTKERHTDVVLADSSLSLFTDLIHRPLTLSEYLSHDYTRFMTPLRQNPTLESTAQMLMNRQHTTLGDANLARKLSRMAEPNSTAVSIVYARDLHIRQFKTDNLILLGARRANPWVELIEEQLNYRFGYDEEHRYAIVENRAPSPGEQNVYSVHKEPGHARRGYAVLAYLPNPAGEGTVLYVAGTEMEGTEAGGDILMSEHWMKQLREVLGPSFDGKRFPYFELLIGTVVVGGAAPELTIVSHRLRRS